MGLKLDFWSNRNHHFYLESIGKCYLQSRRRIYQSLQKETFKSQEHKYICSTENISGIQALNLKHTSLYQTGITNKSNSKKNTFTTFP